MNIRHSLRLIALTVLGLSACLPAPAGLPKDKFAVFTQKDPVFTETITLYTDGRYKQEETQSQAKPYQTGSIHGLTLPYLGGASRGGAWLLLDKEGGVPLSYKPGESFPTIAVIELKSAMPFGFVWDNQSPFGMQGDRYLEAGLFQSTKVESIKSQTLKPAGVMAQNGTIVPGSPLPNLVRP